MTTPIAVLVSVFHRPLDSRRGVLPGLGPVARALATLLRRWQQRHSQRRALGELDDRLLDDVGISRQAATREASRPFWR